MESDNAKTRADIYSYSGIVLLAIAITFISIYRFHGTGFHTVGRIISLVCFIAGFYLLYKWKLMVKAKKGRKSLLNVT